MGAKLAMQAEELLKAGDLGGALSALQDQVRKSPADAKLRVFLFQLLCVIGDWKRAITQLKVCGELDETATPMAQTYREAIICEVYREKVFAGEKAPLVFGEPNEWIALLIEALKPEAAGKAEKAAGLREKAFDMADAVAGTLNGEPFEWVADADMRLGPVLEIIVNGRYFWAPFDTVHKIKAEEPSDLRDRVWTAVEITWANGGDAVALIPTRYAGTLGAEDSALKMSHATSWDDSGTKALGQRLLATDQADCALMDLRELVLGDPPVVELRPEEGTDEASESEADG